MTSAGAFLTDGAKLDDFRRTLGRKYELDKQSSDSYRLELFDTFDWRLHGKGLFAYSREGSFAVGRSPAEPPSLVSSIGEAAPHFWWDLEDAQARAFLQGITGIRALLPLAEAKVADETFNVRDREGKIVCRLSHLTCHLAGGSVRSYLLLRPLRGYAIERDRISSMAVKSGMEELKVPVLEDLLSSSGRDPGGYSSKLDLRLGRKMTISEAVVLINRELLSTIRSNIEGVIADYDTEFLHDLRVATRRTRACLTQLKEGLPAEAASRYATGFKAVAQRCNELRDLDVYLLERQSFYDMLPEHIRSGLDQYFKYVARKRARRHKEFAAYLRTDGFESLLSDWESFLQDPDVLVSTRPAIEVAGAKIQDRFGRIVKKGRKIEDGSPKARLHELRIECKKLRYLLEFFHSFYPANKMDELISHLKGFQDNLGEFNDLTVQREDLQAYLKSTKAGGNPQLRDAAIGGLLTALNGRQVVVRKEFYRRFARFDSSENRSLYAELFRRRKA